MYQILFGRREDVHRYDKSNGRRVKMSTKIHSHTYLSITITFANEFSFSLPNTSLSEDFRLQANRRRTRARFSRIFRIIIVLLISEQYIRNWQTLYFEVEKKRSRQYQRFNCGCVPTTYLIDRCYCFFVCRLKLFRTCRHAISVKVKKVLFQPQVKHP